MTSIDSPSRAEIAMDFSAAPVALNAGKANELGLRPGAATGQDQDPDPDPDQDAGNGPFVPAAAWLATAATSDGRSRCRSR
jgi:hypothetical protein